MSLNYRELEQDLKRVEGFRAYAYLDSKGLTTVGFGRCLDRRVGGGISGPEALYLLKNDIVKTAAALDALIPWWMGLDDFRARVLIDMAFNMGVGGLLEFHKMLGHVERGEWDAAADDMLDSNYAREVPVRAAENARRMRTGSVLAVQP